VRLSEDFRAVVTGKIDATLADSTATRDQVRNQLTKRMRELTAQEDHHFDLVGNPDWPHARVVVSGDELNAGVAPIVQAERQGQVLVGAGREGQTVRLFGCTYETGALPGGGRRIESRVCRGRLNCGNLPTSRVVWHLCSGSVVYWKCTCRSWKEMTECPANKGSLPGQRRRRRSAAHTVAWMP
jgi:hypothetical protein